MKKVIGIVLAPVVLALGLGSARDSESSLLNTLKGSSAAKAKGLKKSAVEKESSKERDTPAIGRRKPVSPKGKHKARPRLPTLKSTDEAAVDDQNFLKNFISNNITSNALDKQDDLLQDFLSGYAKEEAPAKQEKPLTGGYFPQSYETLLSKAVLKKEKELKSDSAARPAAALEESQQAAKKRAAQLSKIVTQLKELTKEVTEISESLTDSNADKTESTDSAEKAEKAEKADKPERTDKAGKKSPKNRMPRMKKPRLLKAKQTPEPLIA